MITIVDTFEQIPNLGNSHVLTIGNFDGMHLGHQAICKQLVALGHDTSLPTAALTFRNHPSEVLRPQHPVPLLCPPQERYQRLQELGVAQVVALPFTADIAQLSAEEFLTLLAKHIPFQHLVLGHDATIGKGRAGKPEVVQQLAAARGFAVHYLPAFQVGGQVVSSSLIREAIRTGRLDDAARWLGRPCSLSGAVISGRGQGRQIGFPTINVDVSGLCLPPFGVYRVRLRGYPGIANIGVAPTVRQAGPPVLEVHLDKELGKQAWVTVTLEQFIRPEKKFESLEALKAQIARDKNHH